MGTNSPHSHKSLSPATQRERGREKSWQPIENISIAIAVSEKRLRKRSRRKVNLRLENSREAGDKNIIAVV